MDRHCRFSDRIRLVAGQLHQGRVNDPNNNTVFIIFSLQYETA